MQHIVIGGTADRQCTIDLKYLNRHGLIAGATGTGKTVTLQVLAEQLSQQSIPCLVTDVKGDLSGLAVAGKESPKIQARIDSIGLTHFSYKKNPVTFWDLNGTTGHPVRTTIGELGPLLLSNLLELNEAQTGVLYACFKEADENGFLLLDLEDLHGLLNHLRDMGSHPEYGKISSASIGAIKRRLLIFEEQGLDQFIGEPAVSIGDFIHQSQENFGLINVLDASTLSQRSPRLYATILIWLLSELYEELPEVGDQEKPSFIIFLDEAHLLFNNTIPALQDKIEQVIRLIRSKGVGVIFISQSPLDIPDSISNQLGLKIQHALRANTPAEKKKLKAIAETFHINPTLDTESTLPNLNIGEALVSTIVEGGKSSPVERVLLSPPFSQIGPCPQEIRQAIVTASVYHQKFLHRINRHSAYEALKERTQNKFNEPSEEDTKPAQASKSTRSRQSATEAFFKSIARAVGSQVGRQIVRGIMGTLFKRR